MVSLVSRVLNNEPDVVLLSKGQSRYDIGNAADVDGVASVVAELTGARSVGVRNTRLVLEPRSQNFGRAGCPIAPFG